MKKNVSNYRSGKTYSRKPNSKNRKNFGFIILIGITILLFFIFFTGNKSVFKLYFLDKEHASLLQHQQDLENEIEELKEEIEKLEKDKEYQVKVAREEYNMKKENEEVITFEKE
jgi:cell division protein FtsB